MFKIVFGAGLIGLGVHMGLKALLLYSPLMPLIALVGIVMGFAIVIKGIIE